MPSNDEQQDNVRGMRRSKYFSIFDRYRLMTVIVQDKRRGVPVKIDRN